MIEINKYPYTDFHEMNLDWVIKEIKKLNKELSEFEIINSLKWMGRWDITAQYPYWSIVDYNGTGYIAKTEVPSGIDITNSKYWEPVADYSALYANIQNRIDELSVEFNDFKADVIRSIEPFNYGDVITIGDSYLEGWTPDGNVTSWGTYLKRRMNLSDDRYHTFHEGGSGIIAKGNQYHTFKDLLNMAVADTSIVKNNVKYVIIGGGYNDAVTNHPLNEYVVEINNIKNIIRSNYPNANIIIAFVANSGRGDNISYSSFYYTRSCYNIASLNSGIKCIDYAGYNLKAGFNPCMASDGKHPNDLGESYIANTIYNAINGIYSVSTANLQLGSLYMISDESNVSITAYEPLVFEGQDIVSPGAVLNGINIVGSKDISYFNIYPIMTTYIGTAASCTVHSNEGYYETDCTLRINKEGKLNVYPYDINDSHTNYRSLTGIDRVEIPTGTTIKLSRSLA